jgi:hypothetical protein
MFTVVEQARLPKNIGMENKRQRSVVDQTI